MSLENAIETLIVKVEALTQITTELASLRADAIKAVQNEAAPAPKRGKKTEEAPAPEVVEEVPAPAVEEETPAPAPAAEVAPEPAPDTLSDTVKEFMAVAGDDKAKRTEIAGIIKGIFGKVKATKRSEVPAEKQAAVEKAIRAEIEKYDAVAEADDDDLL